LFRAAVRAVTQRAEDGPKPEARRRRGETGKGFGLAARAIMRRIAVMPAGAGAPAWLSDTLDWLNLWQENADNHYALDDDIGAKQDQYFPQP
jgi:hypothetical protein